LKNALMIERIKTPFGFSSTAEDVVQSIDLTGKHAIVTGGSSGIGIETARALAMAGANTTLAVRRPDAGDATCVVKPLLTIGAKWPSPEKFYKGRSQEKKPLLWPEVFLVRSPLI
jgi:short chain dehydrogenase